MPSTIALKWDFDRSINRWCGPASWYQEDAPGPWRHVLSEDGTRTVLEPKFLPAVGQWVRFGGHTRKVLRVFRLEADIFDSPLYVPIDLLERVPDAEAAAREYWGDLWALMEGQA